MKPQLSLWVFSLAVESPPSWQPLFNQVCAAERTGFDRVVLTGEHILFGENLEAYGKPELGGRRGGKQITGPDGCYLEPMVTMAALGAVTSRIRLTTNVMLAALRRPVVLAKQAATLDVLTGGRLDLGVGVGWQREEYEAAGLPFVGRGRLLDHTLEVCQSLWLNQVASYASPELEFERIHQMPKPVQSGGIPIWVSGTVNPRPMERLARFGSGWIPWGEATDSVVHLVADIKTMREMVARNGRDPDEIQVAGTLPVVKDRSGSVSIRQSVAGLGELAEAGVTDVRLAISLPEDAHEAEDYLAEWAAAFRASL